MFSMWVAIHWQRTDAQPASLARPGQALVRAPDPQTENSNLPNGFITNSVYTPFLYEAGVNGLNIKKRPWQQQRKPVT